MEHLKVKVCGMTDIGNVLEISSLSPDYIGFIFYPKSVRYVGDEPDPGLFEAVPATIKKTAVFVNEYFEKVMEKANRYHIEHIQLHGMESPEMCKLLKSGGKTIIKVIPGDQMNETSLLNEYASVCDYLLFDTPVISYGGSGRKFDWNHLEDLTASKPFFLSGGIGPEDAEKIVQMDYRNLFAVDVNSRFELEPGIKDLESLRSFIKRIRNE